MPLIKRCCRVGLTGQSPAAELRNSFIVAFSAAVFLPASPKALKLLIHSPVGALFFLSLPHFCQSTGAVRWTMSTLWVACAACTRISPLSQTRPWSTLSASASNWRRTLKISASSSPRLQRTTQVANQFFLVSAMAACSNGCSSLRSRLAWNANVCVFLQGN